MNTNSNSLYSKIKLSLKKSIYFWKRRARFKHYPKHKIGNQLTSETALPPSINIVTVSSGWILQNIAERISDALHESNCNVSLGTEPRQDCDANFYIDVYNCFKGKTGTLDIGLFTHVHADDMKTVERHWMHLDFIAHMSQRYYDAFSSIYPAERMAVLYPGEIHNGFANKRKINIGIVQRGLYEGKGFYFMLDLFDTIHPLIKEWGHFIFIGKGWDAVVQRYHSLGISATHIQNESYEHYYEYYQKIDYLLIPSLWEGGPMSMIEAYSQSIPVIAANVGWVPDHFVDEDWMMFPHGDSKALLSILERICSKLEARRKSAEKFSYKNYATSLLKIVRDLKEEKEKRIGEKFIFQGEIYNYFYDGIYNSTWQNERAVEIPIIKTIVEKNHGKKILEVGNVLSHYISHCQHDVVDKYEKALGVINQDITTFRPIDRYNIIVSISTLEHVGWDETTGVQPEPQKILLAFENLVNNCLLPGGKLIVTLPIGYNSFLDKILAEGSISFTELNCLKRISYDNKWIATNWDDVREAKFNAPYPWTNALIVGVIEKK